MVLVRGVNSHTTLIRRHLGQIVVSEAVQAVQSLDDQPDVVWSTSLDRICGGSCPSVLVVSNPGLGRSNPISAGGTVPIADHGSRRRRCDDGRGPDAGPVDLH